MSFPLKKGCGHSKYAQFCSEYCQMIAHDNAHEDPLDYWSECEICNERVKAEEEKEISNAGN